MKRSLVVVFAVVGCGGSKSRDVGPVLAANKAKIEARVASAAAIGQAPASPLGACNPSGGPPVRIFHTGGARSFDAKIEGNAFIVYRAQLADLTKPPAKVKYEIPSVGMLHDCAGYVRDAATAHEASRVEACAAAEYLYAVSYQSMTEPVLSDSSYTPGAMTGRIELYKLEGAKPICAFTFEAKTPDSFKTVEAPSRSPQGDLEGAFMSQIARSIDATIAKNVPGAIVDR